MLSVSAFMVLLLAVAVALVYSNPSINLKQDKPTNEFHNNDAKGWLILGAHFYCTLCYWLFSALKN